MVRGAPRLEGAAESALKDDVDFLRAQARKCRWLADRVNSPDVVRTLQQMADDYEARAESATAGVPPASG